MWGEGQRERWGERIPIRHLAVSPEPGLGLDPTNTEIITCGEIKSQLLNWPSHPGAPKVILKMLPVLRVKHKVRQHSNIVFYPIWTRSSHTVGTDSGTTSKIAETSAEVNSVEGRGLVRNSLGSVPWGAHFWDFTYKDRSSVPGKMTKLKQISKEKNAPLTGLVLVWSRLRNKKEKHPRGLA